ncbi:MAG: DUF362 domain-containing protein [Syntrophobacteraceae bacterium]|nr:DUF362 domain-containing protein [Syntrophobacteraceae bacterium]
MDGPVYIVSCPDYDQADEKMETLLSLLGGMSRFVKPGEKIVLKANLLQPAAPEQAVTTHPRIVAAAARMVREAGSFAIIADSPGAGHKYTAKTLNTLYGKTGMFEAARASGAELNFDTTCKPVSFPAGKLVKRFDVINPVTAADGVLGLCKLKTHTLMSITGAVKNNFGVVPGLSKPGYHAKLHDKAQFADMLLDLAEYVSPRLSIMDAVVGMEGDGPGVSGVPRRVGLLLGSVNPLALDIVASEIVGLGREQNPLLLAAARRGLTPSRIEEVEVMGADVSEVRVPGYRLPATIEELGLGKHLTGWKKPLAPYLKDWLSQSPRVGGKRCVACGICRDACPAGAITIAQGRRGKALIDDKRCIRCYCCHELCPEGAVELRRSLMHRLLSIGS